jgi:hypothetical protein
MKFFMKFCLIVIFCLFYQVSILNAQVGIVDRDAKAKPALVVLGTYHMGTHGNNVVNPKVDEVTTSARQKQMLELIEKLKKFNPNKIALECDVENDAKTQDIYNQYLAGTYGLSKSESDQIGFRLAKEMGHKKVYCVNTFGFWDDSAMNYEKYASKDTELDAFLKGAYQNLKKDVDAEAEKLMTLPVTDQLILLNQPERMEKDHQRYFDTMRIGRGKDYVGANYLAWWYGRNMQILTNIIRVTDSLDDRILVIYGAGHSKLLTQFAKESGFYTVENPLKYLKKN